MGAHKQPFYRVVVADSRAPRDGKFIIEEISYYNPMTDPEIKIDAEKAREMAWEWRTAYNHESLLFVKIGNH